MKLIEYSIHVLVEKPTRLANEAYVKEWTSRDQKERNMNKFHLLPAKKEATCFILNFNFVVTIWKTDTTMELEKWKYKVQLNWNDMVGD